MWNIGGCSDGEKRKQFGQLLAQLMKKGEMMDSTHWVYMTISNVEEAKQIGEIVVRERLAACVNILGEIQSMFWWEGEVRSEQEVAMTAKTSSARLPELISRVSELNSYDCPCIVACPIATGFEPFLEWINRETGV